MGKRGSSEKARLTRGNKEKTAGEKWNFTRRRTRNPVPSGQVRHRGTVNPSRLRFSSSREYRCEISRASIGDDFAVEPGEVRRCHPRSTPLSTLVATSLIRQYHAVYANSVPSTSLASPLPHPPYRRSPASPTRSLETLRHVVKVIPIHFRGIGRAALYSSPLSSSLPPPPPPRHRYIAVQISVLPMSMREELTRKVIRVARSESLRITAAILPSRAYKVESKVPKARDHLVHRRPRAIARL